MAVNLRVMIGEGAETQIKTLRLPMSISVHEACAQIREKMPDGGHDHSLFQPSSDTDVRGTWLKPTRTLESYDISGSETLWFRKRHFVVKVKTADEATKAIIVDLMQTVKEVVATIGQKINLSRPEEYSLQWDSDPTWLKSNAPLTEQGSPTEVLVLKKRFYVSDSELDKNDGVQLHLVYVQGRETVVAGMHPTTKEEAVQFAALQAQIEFGAFNPVTHKPGFLKLERYIPPVYRKEKDIEALVLHLWKSLGTISLVDAKFKYHQLCMTLRTYGTTIFPVQLSQLTAQMQSKGKKPVLTPIKIGLTATQIQFMSVDCRTITKFQPYDHLKRWSFTEADVTLDFGEFDEEPAVLKTPQGEEIASLISGYIDILVRRTKEQPPEDTEPGQKAEVQTMGNVTGRAVAGMTTSTQGGWGDAAMQKIADIKDLEGMRDIFKSIPIPTLRELNVEGSGRSATTALTAEQLAKQMASHAESIGRLMQEMEKAALNKDAQKLADLSKAMALAVMNLLQDGQAAALASGDPAVQQRLLDACRSVLDAVNAFTTGLMALAANPNDEAARRAVAGAKVALENAVASLLAAARGAIGDDATSALLAELAKAVVTAVSGLCAAATTSVRPSAALTDSCANAQSTANVAVSSAEVLGPLISDKAVSKLLGQRVMAVKPACNNVMEQLRGASIGPESTGALQKMGDVDAAIKQLLYALENPIVDVDPRLLPYLRAAHTALEESLKVMEKPGQHEVVQDAAKTLKGTVEPVVTHVKSAAESSVAAGTDDGSGARNMALAAQMALATKNLMVLAAQPANSANLEKIRDAAAKVNFAVRALVAEDALLMHKVALVDRSKQACADSLRAADFARVKVRGGAVDSGMAKSLLAAATAASDSVNKLLDAVRKAVGHDGDDRLNVNALAETAERFCPVTVKEVIVPVKQLGQESASLCQDSAKSVQRLLLETRAYKAVGRIADIDVAIEPFRAAEAILQATIFANDASKLKPVGTRSQALADLPAAGAKYGTCLRNIVVSTKNNQSPVAPLGDLSNACQSVMVVVRGLASNSRFKHERGLLINAGKTLAGEINKLIASLKRGAAEDLSADVVSHEIAPTITAAVAALQRLVALAQQEGGSVHLDTEGNDAGVQADAELEARVAQALDEIKSEIDGSASMVNSLVHHIPPPVPGDPHSQVRSAVLDAVRALVNTTSNVMGAACVAQAELVRALAVATTRAAYSRDPALAEGLVDAARQVALAIRQLTAGLTPDTIDTLSQKELVAHAEDVGKACEILATAVRAGTRAAGDAQTKKLVEAAQAVSNATRQLVEAAKMIEDLPEVSPDEDIDNYGIDAYTLQEIKIQMKIAELEYKLEKAKQRYTQLMKSTTSATKWNVVK